MIDKENLKYPWMSQFTINACRRSMDGHLRDAAREYLIQGRDLARIISCSFSWSFTPQGHDYWSDIENSYND